MPLLSTVLKKLLDSYVDGIHLLTSRVPAATDLTLKDNMYAPDDSVDVRSRRIPTFLKPLQDRLSDNPVAKYIDIINKIQIPTDIKQRVIDAGINVVDLHAAVYNARLKESYVSDVVQQINNLEVQPTSPNPSLLMQIQKEAKEAAVVQPYANTSVITNQTVELIDGYKKQQHNTGVILDYLTRNNVTDKEVEALIDSSLHHMVGLYPTCVTFTFPVDIQDDQTNIIQVAPNTTITIYCHIESEDVKEAVFHNMIVYLQTNMGEYYQIGYYKFTNNKPRMYTIASRPYYCKAPSEVSVIFDVETEPMSESPLKFVHKNVFMVKQNWN